MQKTIEKAGNGVNRVRRHAEKKVGGPARLRVIGMLDPRHFPENRLFTLFLLTVILLFSNSPSASAGRNCETGEHLLVYINETGDVLRDHTRSPAAIHLQGTFAIASADYFRGRFDGVPEALDDWSAQPAFRLIFELAEQITFTAGMTSGISDAAPFSPENLEVWYEANPHFGFAGKISHMYGGLTYTLYGSPNDTAASTEEIALDMRSTLTVLGPLYHWVKIVYAINSGGTFFEIGIEPDIRFSPVTLSFPFSVATGWNDYYGKGDGDGYVQIGIKGAIPLTGYIPARYGQWCLEPALDVLFRDNSLADRQFDDAGSVVFIGAVALRFIY